MREYIQLGQVKERPSLFSRAASAVSRSLPVGFYRKIMERMFINFGVESTNICNANCSFCGYRFMQRKKQVMPLETHERVVTEFSRLAGGTINYTPTVGDPLVDKHLLKKIRFAASLPNIRSQFLFTNGILLDRFGYDEILLSGITRLALSTYLGTREGYTRYYGRDKYDKVVTNLLGICRRNCELGSPVKITLHLRVSRNEDQWRGTDTYKDLAELIGEQNIDYLTSYDAWSGMIGSEDVPEECGIVEPLPIEEKKKEPCFELYRRMHVLSDGNVGACVCVDIEGEINIGNVNEQSLTEIWRGPKLKKYRQDWLKGNLPKVCVQCTRYTPLGEFIEDNRKRILTDYLSRSFPRLFRIALRTQARWRAENLDSF